MTATSEQQLSLEDARAYLLERARDGGVTLEVYGERSAATEIEAFAGEVSEFKLAARQGVALRALVRGAWGHSFSENLSRPALDRAAPAPLGRTEPASGAGHIQEGLVHTQLLPDRGDPVEQGHDLGGDLPVQLLAGRDHHEGRAEGAGVRQRHR